MAIPHVNKLRLNRREKIDHLLSRQWERLVEIQQIQIELMTELLALKEDRE